MSALEDRAERIMGISIGPDPYADNLAITICESLSDSPSRPDDDKDEDGEGGWSPWVLEQYEIVRKKIVAFVVDFMREEGERP